MRSTFTMLGEIDVGAEVLRRRTYRRLSQRELAAATGSKISQSAIARLEDGSTSPHPRIIRALESVLGRLDEPDPLQQVKSGAAS